LAANKRKILANAQKYLQKGQLDKALKEYQTLVELDPRDSNSRLKLGDVHLRQGNRDAAIEAYKKVAVQFTKDGFDAKAVALYKQITKIDEKRWEIYEPLAELYERLGLTAEALAALQIAADAHRREGKRREALDLLRKMASLDPTNTTSRLKIADLLVQAEMSRDALAEYEAVAEELERQGAREQLPGVYERMLELAPERTEPLAALSRVLLAQGQGERAEPFARRLVEADPDSVEGHELLAEILRGQGREDAAEATYRRLAELYRTRGDEEKAREIAQRFLAGEDLSTIAGDELGGDPEDSLIGTLGGPGEPLVEDRPADAGNPEEPGSEEPGVSGDGDAGGPEGAGPQATGDPGQLLAEARVYLRYGKPERAAATLETLLAAQPDHVEALECLGEARVEAGDREGAAEVWRRAAEEARGRKDLQTSRELGERLAALDPTAAEPSEPSEPASGEAPPPRADGADPELGPATLEDVDLEIEIGDGPAEAEEAGPGFAGEDELVSGAGESLDGAGEPGLEGGEPDGGSLGPGEDDLELDVDISLSGFDEPGFDDASGDQVLEEDGPSERDAGSTEAPDASGLSREPEGLEETVLQRSGGAEPGASSGGSSTTPQQIAEDLEEADFYFQQGMLDEAENIYRRILAAVPSQPRAQLRLGEIAERRGGDPGKGLSAPQPSPEEAGEPAADPADELGAELVDWGAEEGAGQAETGERDAATAEGAEASETGPEIEVDLDLDVEESGGSPPEERVAGAPEASPARPAGAEGQEDAPAFREPCGPAAGGLAETQPELPEDPGATAPPDDLGDSLPAPEAAEPSALEVGPAASAGEEGPEEASFDLAAELSDVFEDERSGESFSGVSDHGFEAVFREFKKGVREQLSEGDSEAHYDLGIAYREMGLLEDALGEFRTALASPERRLSCLHTLGLCALDLGRPEDAVSHLEQALALPEVPEREQAALRFDLGRAFEERGDRGRARAAYQAVATVDPDYQDVAVRLEALSSEGESLESGESVAAAEANEVEAFESFDDLIAEAEAIMGEDEEDGEPAGAGGGAEEPAAETGGRGPGEGADDTRPDPSTRRKRRKISFL